MRKAGIHFYVNAPIVVWFVGLSTLALIANVITNGWTNEHIFSVYNSSFSDPLTFVRFFTHVLGHADLQHYVANMTTFLLLAPLLEEKYGSVDLFVIIVSTALVTGLVNFFFFPNVRLIGASGVVFAMILAGAFTGIKNKAVPITFVLVVIIYLGQEIYSAFLIKDNISHFTHIIGGFVGAWFGYRIAKARHNN